MDGGSALYIGEGDRDRERERRDRDGDYRQGNMKSDENERWKRRQT
jgi:hypothetical protein